MKTQKKRYKKRKTKNESLERIRKKLQRRVGLTADQIREAFNKYPVVIPDSVVHQD